MGLDNYFCKDAIIIEEIEWPDTHLCGGLLSGGFGSFRGKVYDDYVEKITGKSLYEDSIDTNSVREMGRKLRDHVQQLEHDLVSDDEEIHIGTFNITMKEAKDLATLFEFAASHEMELIAWY